MSTLLRTCLLSLGAFALLESSAQTVQEGNKGTATEDIRLNQIGYYPHAVKKAVVVNSNAASFELLDRAGKKVFEGKLGELGFWDKSGEKIKQADFSSFKDTGYFTLKVSDKGKSYPFRIQGKLYEEALRASIKSYYLQRCSMPIDAKYAGEFARAAGHPDTMCFYHPSTGHLSGGKASTKGWYDAGDYNKYIVNTGVTLGILMTASELYPQIAPDRFCNIPESGNGINDLLDEMRYELEWVLSMQDTDGGVFNKLTTLAFDAFEMPEKDKAKRYFVGKTTTAALDFAANTAQAARLYQATDRQFSDALLKASRKAFEWALQHPDIEFKNPADVSTGGYDAKLFKDEFFWAASELYVSTSESQYLDIAKKYQREVTFTIGNNWSCYLYNLGCYTLLSPKSPLPKGEKDKLKSELLQLAESLLAKTKAIPYGIPLDQFEWGSNSDILDASMLFAIAWRLSKEQKFMDAALETTDYIFGKNAVGFSFLTGFGSKSTMNPHHRPSASDGVEHPVPGLLAGGANSSRQDENGQPWGVKYPDHHPAKSYIDAQGSYASNEIAINWNAPLVFVLAFLESEMK